ncbi:MAG: DUF1801 domain-containing protein [Flavobacteriales bacterium]
MAEVTDFIYSTEGSQREILLQLHELLSSDLELTDKIRFKIPFYYRKSWICYLNPIKGNGIELAFLRGNELSNTHGLLEARGRKQVAGIALYNTADMPMREITEIIHEAILLDDAVPYAAKRRGGF